jgi:tape measure domain-containing protein
VAEAVVRLRVDASGASEALDKIGRKTNSLQGSFNTLRNAIAATGLVVLGRNAVNTSANFEKLNVRLELLTKSSEDFAKSQQIAADAQKAFGLSAVEALQGVTDITARLAPLGTSVEDIKTVFFGFNTAAKLAGSSAIESSNAFRQLAQALGSGRLAGDEFRSVSEQVPTVLAPIADELGVTIGELKKLAADGKLTSDVVLRALGRVGNEGSEFLKQLLENDPTQVFKNFSNATEDLSRAFGDQLRPAVEGTTKVLTSFITKLTEFINSDAGKAALLLTVIAGSIKAIAVAAPLAQAAVAAFAIKVGALKIAVLGLSGALAASGIGAFALALGFVTTKIIQTRREQKELNDTITKGAGEEVAKALEKQEDILGKINERLINANGRTKKNLEEKKKEVLEDIALLEGRQKTLEKEQEITEEKKKQNEEHKKSEDLINKQADATDKLREKMTAVGEEIEGSIKNNLRDAITGAKSFGEAMSGVLNRIRDKIIDAQLDKLVGGFGEAFGAGASGGKKKGLGGFLGGVLGGLFAAGGRPPVGKASIVGERGPELFVPKVAGTIIPNSAMGGGGDSVVNNITVSVDATGSAVSGSSADGNELGQQIAAVIQSELIKQKRVGGLLA